MEAKVVYQQGGVCCHQVFTRDARGRARTCAHPQTHTPAISEGQWVEFDQFSRKIWGKKSMCSCVKIQRGMIQFLELLKWLLWWDICPSRKVLMWKRLSVCFTFSTFKYVSLGNELTLCTFHPALSPRTQGLKKINARTVACLWCRVGEGLRQVEA